MSLGSDADAGRKASNALPESDGARALDDQSGEQVVPHHVRNASEEEMASFKDMGLREGRLERMSISQGQEADCRALG